MKAETKKTLFSIWQLCDNEDKSTEYMIQYMQDMVGVDLDCVLNFIQKQSKNRPKELI